MSSYRQFIFHLTFRTKYNIPAIELEHKKELYRYIWGIIKKQEEHHKKVSYEREYTRLLKEHGVNYDERHI